jgi:hypothetical protein
MFKVSEVVDKGVVYLLQNFLNELQELYNDLSLLTKNRKYNLLEKEAVLAIDGILDFYIERASGFVFREKESSELSELAMRVLESANEIRAFIYDNFDDLFDQSFQSQNLQCIS